MRKQEKKHGRHFGGICGRKCREQESGREEAHGPSKPAVGTQKEALGRGSDTKNESSFLG